MYFESSKRLYTDNVLSSNISGETDSTDFLGLLETTSTVAIFYLSILVLLVRLLYHPSFILLLAIALSPSRPSEHAAARPCP